MDINSDRILVWYGTGIGIGMSSSSRRLQTVGPPVFNPDNAPKHAPFEAMLCCYAYCSESPTSSGPPSLTCTASKANVPMPHPVRH
jgi:hypothetical protein